MHMDFYRLQTDARIEYFLSYLIGSSEKFTIDVLRNDCKG